MVLLLHGGAGRETPTPVSGVQPSVLRMVPVALRVAAASRGRLLVARVVNTYRGWDASRTPVQDAVRALDDLADRYGELPACLVGHSLGGRAAVRAAVERPRVRGVVALAPWVHADDGRGLRGRRVLVVHGSRDAVAPEGRALAMARALADENDVGVVRLAQGGHALLREQGVVDALAADFVRSVLLGREPRSDLLRRLDDGEQVLTV